jgi:sodium-dependent phosphate cotransporter
VVVFFRGVAGYFPEPLDGIFLITMGIVITIFSIYLISKLLKVVMVGRAKNIFEIAVGRGPIAGIAAGILMTILVQSSTTTTCLIVPLAAAGVMTLQQVYPFTLGANIGTTVTAVLAATGISGATQVYALQIAMVHFLFNFFGVLIIYCIPFLCRIPILVATKFASLASERKYLAFVYIIGVFFVIPDFFLGMTKLFG